MTRQSFHCIHCLTSIDALILLSHFVYNKTGIARRVTHYADGLRELGCDVHLLSPESVDESSNEPAVLPFTNPWNFTAQMFVVRPKYFMNLVFRKSNNYDVVHVVLPANLSGCLLLSAFRLARMMRGGKGPKLVCSWHCNLIDYTAHILPGPIVGLVKFVGVVGVGILPCLADRLLTPTRATEPQLTSLFGERAGKMLMVLRIHVYMQIFATRLVEIYALSKSDQTVLLYALYLHVFRYLLHWHVQDKLQPQDER